jgi:3-keto-5-aminohexanoate cleavage enzyme
VFFRRGELAESNAQFVRRAADLVHAAGREVATPAWLRERLGVS